MNKENLYDELSRRMFGFDRNLVKRYLYLRAYSAPGLDPWIASIIDNELAAICRDKQS